MNVETTQINISGKTKRKKVCLRIRE